MILFLLSPNFPHILCMNELMDWNGGEVVDKWPDWWTCGLIKVAWWIDDKQINYLFLTHTINISTHNGLSCQVCMCVCVCVKCVRLCFFCEFLCMFCLCSSNGSRNSISIVRRDQTLMLVNNMVNILCTYLVQSSKKHFHRIRLSIMMRY